MMPTIIDGKVWVPIIPTPETDGTIWHAMSELSLEGPDYGAILWWRLFGRGRYYVCVQVPLALAVLEHDFRDWRLFFYFSRPQSFHKESRPILFRGGFIKLI